MLPEPTRDALRPVLFGGVNAPTVPLAAPPARHRVLASARPESRTVHRVSVLIPTLDAGLEFERLLASLQAQDGLEEIECVVVDSGSVDGTPERAQRLGARVLSISPEEFGHGRARNAAAELSSSSILVMLVQDVALLGRRTLRTLVDELLAEDGIAAVSARQVPRSDADLYGAFVVYNHDRALAKASPAAVRRSEVTVDNVCAVVRREAWEEIRFADVEFAEDLDFGVRALALGWKLRRSESAAVAHSHNRSAGYHMRRNVADRLYVAPLVGDRYVARPSTAPLDELLAAAGEFLQELAGALRSGLRREAPLSQHVAELCAALGEAAARGYETRTVSDLRKGFVRSLESEQLERFATAHRHVSEGDGADFAAKAAASLVGRLVGDALRLSPHEPTRRRFLTGV